MKYIKYLPYIGTLAFIILLLMNLNGCLNKTKEVVITKTDTIYQVRHDSFMVKVPVPVEKKVIIKITEKTNVDSLEQIYTNRINDLQRSIVEYQNAIFDLQHETPPEEIVITANEYKDTFDTDTYNLKVAIGVVGHLESFDYSLEQFEKKITPPACPKNKLNFISLGMEVGFDGQNEAKLGYWHKFMYGKVGYKLRDYNINNFTAEAGLLIRF